MTATKLQQQKQKTTSLTSSTTAITRTIEEKTTISLEIQTVQKQFELEAPQYPLLSTIFICSGLCRIYSDLYHDPDL
jgi:rRNA processing protein Krr1/Pno1